MSYLRLLLSIDRPADFFRGYRLITTLARRDNARVAQFREDLAAHTTEKAVLEKRTQESIALTEQAGGGAPRPRRAARAQDRSS